MPGVLRLVVVAALGASLLPSAASAARVSRTRVDDLFSQSAIDTHTWFVGFPATMTITQAGGKLSMSVAADAVDGFFGDISTNCKARGDFDAQVSFRLNEWPPINAVWVSLFAGELGGVNAYRASVPAGEWYGGFFPPDEGGIVNTTDRRGVLRLVRLGTTATAYYQRHGAWVEIASGTAAADDTSIAVAVFNASGNGSFGGRPVRVTFDSFHLEADEIVCAA